MTNGSWRGRSFIFPFLASPWLLCNYDPFRARQEPRPPAGTSPSRRDIGLPQRRRPPAGTSPNRLVAAQGHAAHQCVKTNWYLAHHHLLKLEPLEKELLDEPLENELDEEPEKDLELPNEELDDMDDPLRNVLDNARRADSRRRRSLSNLRCFWRARSTASSYASRAARAVDSACSITCS